MLAESGVEIVCGDVTSGGVVDMTGVDVRLKAAVAVDAGSAVIVGSAPALEPIPAEEDIEVVSDDSAAGAASLLFAACRLMVMGICVLPLAWRGVTSASAIPSSESRMKGLPTSAYKRLKCRCLMHLCIFSTSFVSACLAMYS